MSLNDQNWMQKALRLAVRGIGRVSPNPPVGCVIVKENKVIGRGWTQPGGRPHAEVMALQQAGGLSLLYHVISVSLVKILSLGFLREM